MTLVSLFVISRNSTGWCPSHWPNDSIWASLINGHDVARLFHPTLPNGTTCKLGFIFVFVFLFIYDGVFLSFYTGWILDLPSIGIYSMCPQRDSCGTASLATIFFLPTDRSTLKTTWNFQPSTGCSWKIRGWNLYVLEKREIHLGFGCPIFCVPFFYLFCQFELAVLKRREKKLKNYY